MLFPYTYVPHQMEKMQTFIDFIFHEVWCKAPANSSFSLDLFLANAELYEVMKAFHYSDATGAEFFLGHVERIHGLFATLTPAQISQFKQWYEGNNDLEKVCANDSVACLARYTELSAFHQNLSTLLASFFKGLYSQSLLGLAALKAKIGEIDDHYHTFTQINKGGKCPFCGITDLQGEYHSTREAYDHYLPKTLYPFNSINLHNLVPACHHCNSSYKTRKDPAHTPKDPMGGANRRRVFYPFTNTPRDIELQVYLKHSDIEHLTPADINLQFGPDDIREEIETWKDVYGIEERYKAKLCGENDGMYWLTQVLDECQAYDKHPCEILAMRTQQAQNRPYADCNFLRRPFLEACSKRGLFDSRP